MSTQLGQSNIELARAGYDAYNARDFERGASNFAEDGEIVNVPFGLSLHGKSGYLQFVQGWATAFPDSKLEVTNVVVDDSGFAVEYTARGTHTGPLQGPNGEIPATGKTAEMRLCDAGTIRNGKIKSIRSYFDSATFMRQLGLI